jgi:hypothetical protein
MALEQHQCVCDEVRASLPRRGACRGDLVGADGLPVVLVLGIAEGAEDDVVWRSRFAEPSPERRRSQRRARCRPCRAGQSRCSRNTPTVVCSMHSEHRWTSTSRQPAGLTTSAFSTRNELRTPQRSHRRHSQQSGANGSSRSPQTGHRASSQFTAAVVVDRQNSCIPRGHRLPHQGRSGGRSANCGSGGSGVSPSSVSLRRAVLVGDLAPPARSARGWVVSQSVRGGQRCCWLVWSGSWR